MFTHLLIFYHDSPYVTTFHRRNSCYTYCDYVTITLRVDISIITPLSFSLNNLKMLGILKGNVHTHVAIDFRKKIQRSDYILAPFFGEMDKYKSLTCALPVFPVSWFLMKQVTGPVVLLFYSRVYSLD